MDKTGWIAVLICSLGLLWWCDNNQRYVREAQAAEAAKKKAAAAENGTDTGGNGTAGEGGAGETAAVPDVPAIEETLSSERADWVFSNKGGGLQRAVLKGHNLRKAKKDDGLEDETRAKVEINRHATMPIGALSKGVGTFEKLPPYEIVAKDEKSITMRTVDPATQLEITKIYSLTGLEDAGAGYLINLDLKFRYAGAAGNFNGEGYYLYAGAAAPLFPGEMRQMTGFDFMRNGKDKFRHADYFRKKPERIDYNVACEDLVWAGSQNQFYTTNVCAAEPYNASIWAKRFEVKLPTYEDSEKTHYAVHGAMGLPAFNLAPGEIVSMKYQIYAGPKDYGILKHLDTERDEVMGFDRLPIIGWIAEPFSKLLSGLMAWLHNIFGNYGWAIIFITVIIRFAIWPLHIKSQRTMKRMSLLQPKMAEMKEKHADDPQKMNQEMMMMYRDYGVNPLGGCLPILLQMPIFFGFFSMLRQAAELRHEPWLSWVQDLSMPDTVFRLPEGIPLIGGFPLNILPILMGITMIWQMKMTPTTGDKMQRRIFMLMPLIFLIFCYGFASALALYWTAQNIISIGQTWLLRNRQEVELVKKPRPTRSAPGRPGRQPSFNEREKKAPKRKQIRTGGRSKKKK